MGGQREESREIYNDALRVTLACPNAAGLQITLSLSGADQSPKGSWSSALIA